MFGELPGIFARFVRGLRRLRKRGDWDIPLDCREAHADWLTHSNPLNAFREECVRLDPESQIEPKILWPVYRQWIKDNETSPGSIHGLKRIELYTRLDSLLGNRESIGHNLFAWKGWRLHDPRMDDIEIVSESEADWDDVDA